MPKYNFQFFLLILKTSVGIIVLENKFLLHQLFIYHVQKWRVLIWKEKASWKSELYFKKIFIIIMSTLYIFG